MTTDEKYMRAALREAEKASELGEVPIGCVIVYEGKIIGRGYNRRNTDKSTLSHAELTAIRKASRKMNDWRLEKCTLYVTLEPCQMCSGAIVQARIPRVVMGCRSPKAGCSGSVLNILQNNEFNHQVEVTENVLEEECSNMLKEFFNRLRQKTREEKEQRENYVPTGKPLSELSKEELWLLFPILIAEYNPAYPAYYEEERSKITKALEAKKIPFYRINHIGSTSVAGLLSKPTVDILLELEDDADVAEVRATLKDIGFLLMSSEEDSFYDVYNKGYTPYGFADKVYHLHVRRKGNHKELYFRDYLKEHPPVAAKYAKLKQSLAGKYRNDRDGYTKAKTDFVRKYTERAMQEYKGKYDISIERKIRHK